MAFDPVEFFQLAEEIYANNTSQAAKRAVIGRSYYAAFLTARNKAGIPSKTQDGHLRVIQYYQSKDAASAVVGNQLNDLRKMRTDADYDCEMEILSRHAGSCLSQSRSILKALGCVVSDKPSAVP
jgi:uncharacterized protein (UPF0332 family)